jgi:two-component system chemotaxis response regulator CheB
MRKMLVRRPDVIVLDLEMPKMDGLTFLRRIMAEDPIPVVICSALAGDYAAAAVRAIEAGAVEVIRKARLGVRDFLYESAVRLSDAVRGAAAARLDRAAFVRPLAAAHVRLDSPRSAPALEITTEKVIAMGTSTGGTDALHVILSALPPDSPGVVVVQHMPAAYTAAFAKRLDQRCVIDVKQAETGDWIRQGRALIAPGDRHLVVKRSGARYTAEVIDGPLVSRHRPSVDVLFESAAREVAANAVGVILTGMGKDGADGLGAMKRAGARTIAQDEASCVVFGMPGEAVARGVVDEVVSLPNIAARVMLNARAGSHPKKGSTL